MNPRNVQASLESFRSDVLTEAERLPEERQTLLAAEIETIREWDRQLFAYCSFSFYAICSYIADPRTRSDLLDRTNRLYLAEMLDSLRLRYPEHETELSAAVQAACVGQRPSAVAEAIVETIARKDYYARNALIFF